VTKAESAWDSQICLGDLLGVADVAFVANGQLVTALRSAASQHGASVLCLHALTEAMRLGALPVIWLKRTFWHCSWFLSAWKQTSKKWRYVREYKNLIIRGCFWKCKRREIGLAHGLS